MAGEYTYICFDLVSCVVLIVRTILEEVFGMPTFLEILGFGPTHIDLQRQAIKAFWKPVFSIMHSKFGWNIHQYTFIAYKSWQVKERLALRPDIAALQDQFDRELEALRKGFGMGTLDTGERQRIARQYLANAVSCGWSKDQVIQCWISTLVVQYKRRGLDPPPELQPPAPPYDPFLGWQRGQIEAYNWLTVDGMTADRAHDWVVKGTLLDILYGPIPTRAEMVPAWPQPITGQSWDGSKWYVTSDHPEVVYADPFLYDYGRQITRASWDDAQTKGPKVFIYVNPRTYAGEPTPVPATNQQTIYWHCVDGVCYSTTNLGYLTKAYCEADCKIKPAPPPQECDPKCQTQIDTLKSGVAWLKDFVLNSVWKVAQDALTKATQAFNKAEDAQRCCAQQTSKLRELADYVYQKLAPQAQQAYDLAKQAQADNAGQNQRLSGIDKIIQKELRPGIQHARDLAQQALKLAKQALDLAKVIQDDIARHIKPQITNIQNTLNKFITSQKTFNTYINNRVTNFQHTYNVFVKNFPTAVKTIVLANCEQIRKCLDQGKKDHPQKACEEGRTWWGLWAECWLQAHTPATSLPDEIDATFMDVGAWVQEMQVAMDEDSQGQATEILLNTILRFADHMEEGQAGPPGFGEIVTPIPDYLFVPTP